MKSTHLTITQDSFPKLFWSVGGDDIKKKKKERQKKLKTTKKKSSPVRGDRMVGPTSTVVVLCEGCLLVPAIEEWKRKTPFTPPW